MKNFQKQIIISIIITLGLTLFSVGSVLAADEDTIADKMLSKVGLFDTLPGGGNEEGRIEASIGRAVQAFLSVFGILFLVLMVYGGYKWMLARGKDEEVTKAKEIIKAAIIGLIIALLAYAITSFVVWRIIIAA